MQTLAEQLGICDDIAHEKAEYWRALALPLSDYFECAKAAVVPYITVQTNPEKVRSLASAKLLFSRTGRPAQFWHIARALSSILPPIYIVDAAKGMGW